MFLNMLASYVGTQKVPDGEGGTTTQYIYGDIWTSFAKDALSAVFLWICVAAIVILVAVGVFIRFKKADFLRTYVKYALAFFTGLAMVILIVMLALEFFDMSESGAVFDLVLIPSAVTGGVAILGIAVCYVCSLYSKKVFKASLWASLATLLAAVVALFVCLCVYFSSGDAANNNGVSQGSVSDLGLYLCTAGLVIVIALLTVFLGWKDRKGFDSRSIAYAAVCIAMSFALSYIKLWEMPQGGSITLASLLPLMIYSYMFGVRKGVFAGFIYGLLQAIQDPWLIHPAQFLLDYPVAFAAIGVAGMFRNVEAFQFSPQLKFAAGAIVASVLRFLAHIFSGVFAFSEYAGDQNPWTYSLAYNSFVFIDIALVIVVGVVVFSSKAFMNIVERYNRPVKPAAQPAEAMAAVQPAPAAAPLPEQPAVQTNAAPAAPVQANDAQKRE